jgi:hypothetical protein
MLVRSVPNIKSGNKVFSKSSTKSNIRAYGLKSKELLDHTVIGTRGEEIVAFGWEFVVCRSQRLPYSSRADSRLRHSAPFQNYLTKRCGYSSVTYDQLTQCPGSKLKPRKQSDLEFETRRCSWELLHKTTSIPYNIPPTWNDRLSEATVSFVSRNLVRNPNSWGTSNISATLIVNIHCVVTASSALTVHNDPRAREPLFYPQPAKKGLRTLCFIPWVLFFAFWKLFAFN